MRSPPCSACPSGGSRRRRGSGRGCCRGSPACCCRTSSGSTSVGLTFLVIAALAAALIGQLQSLWVTLLAGLAIGIVQACATPFESIGGYRSMTPFLFAIVALLWFARKQPALVRV